MAFTLPLNDVPMKSRHYVGFSGPELPALQILGHQHLHVQNPLCFFCLSQLDSELISLLYVGLQLAVKASLSPKFFSQLKSSQSLQLFLSRH